ncbi:MAG: sulfite exporter TauE/SafE family protein [Polyangiales bacterium]
MTTDIALKLLLIGFSVGVASGMLGIGGGVLVIPALMLLLDFPQPRAVGTSLAMLLPPIGIFAVMRHHRAGNVAWAPAMLMAAAFSLGALGGASVVSRAWVSERALRLVFVGFLLYIASTLLFRSERRVWAALGTLVFAAGHGVAYLALRALGRRWERTLDLREAYRARLGEEMPPEYEI